MFLKFMLDEQERKNKSLWSRLEDTVLSLAQ